MKGVSSSKGVAVVNRLYMYIIIYIYTMFYTGGLHSLKALQ